MAQCLFSGEVAGPLNMSNELTGTEAVVKEHGGMVCGIGLRQFGVCVNIKDIVPLV